MLVNLSGRCSLPKQPSVTSGLAPASPQSQIWIASTAKQRRKARLCTRACCRRSGSLQKLDWPWRTPSVRCVRPTGSAGSAALPPKTLWTPSLKRSCRRRSVDSRARSGRGARRGPSRSSASTSAERAVSRCGSNIGADPSPLSCHRSACCQRLSDAGGTDMTAGQGSGATAPSCSSQAIC